MDRPGWIGVWWLAFMVCQCYGGPAEWRVREIVRQECPR